GVATLPACLVDHVCCGIIAFFTAGGSIVFCDQFFRAFIEKWHKQRPVPGDQQTTRSPSLPVPTIRLSFLDLRPLIHPHDGRFQISWPNEDILSFGPFFHQGSQFISFRFIHVLVSLFDLHPLMNCFGSCFGFCFDSCRGFFLAASASTEDSVWIAPFRSEQVA